MRLRALVTARLETTCELVLVLLLLLLLFLAKIFLLLLNSFSLFVRSRKEKVFITTWVRTLGRGVLYRFTFYVFCLMVTAGVIGPVPRTGAFYTHSIERSPSPGLKVRGTFSL